MTQERWLRPFSVHRIQNPNPDRVPAMTINVHHGGITQSIQLVQSPVGLGLGREKCSVSMKWLVVQKISWLYRIICALNHLQVIDSIAMCWIVQSDGRCPNGASVPSKWSLNVIYQYSRQIGALVELFFSIFSNTLANKNLSRLSDFWEAIQNIMINESGESNKRRLTIVSFDELTCPEKFKD